MGGRKVIHGALRAAGVELRRKPRQLIRSPAELTVSLEFLAAHWVTHHAGQIATVVQVGAFDGVANDPLVDSISRYGWRAVLVEPQPAPAEALRRRYAGQENVTVVEAAIADAEGSRTLYSVASAPGVPEWTAQWASFDQSHVERHVKRTGHTFQIQEVTVRTLTPQQLLERNGIERLDVLQIDAEGYDLQVLRMFDVPSRLPAIVGYEHAHLTRAERDEALEVLISSGYRAAEVWIDTIAYRSS